MKPCPKVEKPKPKKPKVCGAFPCLCIERVKNPPQGPKKAEDDPRYVCEVKPKLPGFQRCEDILKLKSLKPDAPWPNCPPPPPPPPPPKLSPCEEQEKRERIAECKRRMQRYRE